MPNELRRVRFTFERDFDVRYLAATPVIGDRVSRGERLWRVSSTLEDELGLTVVCERMPLASKGSTPNQT